MIHSHRPPGVIFNILVPSYLTVNLQLSKLLPRSISFAIKKTQMRDNRKKLLFTPNILDRAGNAELGIFPLLLLLIYWLHDKRGVALTSPETSFHPFPFLA